MTEGASSLSAKQATWIFGFAAIACLFPIMSSGVSLMLGILFALLIGNPHLDLTRQVTQKLLQVSIIGLGAGMNLAVIGQVGLQGVGYTAVGISVTLFLGLLLGKILKNDATTSLLLTVGTAICGGSAIAAVSSTIRAKAQETSVALATVFFLNASALFIFPQVGHYFGLTENQFGLWSALAIHDTSSVVGAAIQYGPKATEIATTVKLARALWIIPLSLGVGFFWNRKDGKVAGKPKYPWFILGFLLSAAIVTWIPLLQNVGHWVYAFSKRGLVLALFLIGSALTRTTVRNVGVTPFLQGFSLWVLVSLGTLGAIQAGWIH